MIHRPYLLKTQNTQVKEVDEKMWLMKDSNKGVNYEFFTKIWWKYGNKTTLRVSLTTPLPPTVVFRKMYFLKGGWKSGFLWLLILPLKSLKSVRRHEEFICQYKLFSLSLINSLGFWHFLLINKLMASTYNRWCYYFFTFNVL